MADYDVEYYTPAFTTTEIRHNFIKKVYTILFLQLLFTFGIILISVLIEPVKQFWREHSYLTLIFFGIACCLSIGLACCCPGASRAFPINYIILWIFTVFMALAAGGLSAFYETYIVLLAICITAVVCFAVTIFAIQIKWDMTGWLFYVFVAMIFVSIFGFIITMVFFFFKFIPLLDIMYSAILAILLVLVLMIDTQLIVGGRKYAMSPEDYIFGALILYQDIVLIYIIILGFFRNQ